MGINVFAIIDQSVYSKLVDIESLVEEINQQYGAAGPDEDNEAALFAWADIFRGEGGHILDIAKAQAFDDESGPWYIIHKKGDDWWCRGSNPEQNPEWRKYLEGFKRNPNNVVLFLKARL